MGLGFRVFLLEEDNSINRTSIAKFERLQNQDPKEQLPKYANKRIRYAMAVLEVKGRKPLSVIQMDYGYLSFDSEGRLDSKFLEDGMRVAMEVIPPLSLEDEPKNVISAQDKFAKKKYKNLFKWEPDSKTEGILYDLALE